MFDPDPNWLVSAFALSNSVRALFYLPQIVAVARSVDGARDIALSTWWMWTLNNALGGLYTGVVMGHATLAASFWASCGACLVTIALALRARHRYAPQAVRSAGHATFAHDDVGVVDRVHT